MVEKFSDLIYVRDNALTKEFCENTINLFEKIKYDGDINGNHGGWGAIGVKSHKDFDIKKSWDYLINSEVLPEQDAVFFKSLGEHLKEYTELLSGSMKGLKKEYFSLVDSGYQLQKTYPGDGYIWHNDFGNGGMGLDYGVRILTYIWYLNDVEVDGYTEFMDGTKVQPKAGRILIFPCTWEYMHRGFPPKSEDKYICTGWLHCNT